jgi:PAS domain S-box-containing protein
MIFISDRQGIIQYVNIFAAKQFNTTPDKIIGKSQSSLFPPQNAARQGENISEVFKTGKSMYLENKIEFPNQSLWLGTWLAPIKDRTNNVVSVLGISRDITNRILIEQEVRESEEKFRAVAETSVAVIVIYQGDKFVYVNPATVLHTGYTLDEIFRMNFWDLVHPDYKDLIRERGIARIKGENVPLRYEFKTVTKKGEHRWLDFGVTTLMYQGKPAALGVAFDITMRKKIEDSLRESEKRYRLMHESITDAFVEVSMDGKIIEFNISYVHMLGYTPEEIKKLTYIELTPERWHDYEAQIVKEQIIPRGFSDVYEKEYRKKDGTIFPIELRTFLIRDENGNPHSMWALIRDITHRKQAEEQVNKSLNQMRQLSARLQSIREEESTRIAREIHDELGQTLTGIKMDISFLEEIISEKLNLKDNPVLVEKINSISNLTDSAVQTIRKITTELRPAILDSMGLSAAIEWQTEEFQHRTGIICRYINTAANYELDKQSSTAIFRIIQESLTNIIRHAKAKDVQIKVIKENKNIIFEISDNGTGFTEDEAHKLNSFGILGMKERAMLIGGEFEIHGNPNKGTTVRVRIPLLLSTNSEHKT